jgi:L-threonylcarbamoyladenylate synthase
MTPHRTVWLSLSRGYSREQIVSRAARLLRRGGLVALPTETVYGLAAGIHDEDAVAAIFHVKGRPPDNPMIVHVASWRQAEMLLQDVPDEARALAALFWPGPLTLVLKRNAVVPDIVTAGLDTVAVRMPRQRLTLACIRAAGVPVAAPSANRSGGPSPTTAVHVWNDLRGAIDAVVDGGACRIGVESTVLDLTRREPVILRPGAVLAADIAAVLGRPVRTIRGGAQRPASPGMKYVHYAPRTPLLLALPDARSGFERCRRFCAARRAQGERIGLLAPTTFRRLLPHDAFVSLGAGRPEDYARRLYDGLRALDALDLSWIVCPGIAGDGLGLAVMNRLTKAATRVMRG